MERIRYKPTVEDYNRYYLLNKYLIKRFRNAFLRADHEKVYSWLSLINKNNEQFKKAFWVLRQQENIKKFFNKKIE
ncbi:MAG: hypothetical protein QXH71_00835 [Candidatus Anstonellaceae archaeon]